MADTTFVVAGNATSLADEKTGKILACDTIVRVNNFYFEPVSYLGLRVDLAVMGGDPRVAPFMFETLWQQRHLYDLRAWTSHNPKVVKAGKRRFASTFVPFPDGQDRARPDLDVQVAELIARYQCKPMTGTYAALCAYRLGATSIILTGFDFYEGPKRYAYDAGSRQTHLLGRDLNARAIDASQHDSQLDLALLALVQDAMQGRVFRISSGTLLDGFTDIAPDRDGAAPLVRATNPPSDWAPRAGLYPLFALRAMRQVRKRFRR